MLVSTGSVVSAGEFIINNNVYKRYIVCKLQDITSLHEHQTCIWMIVPFLSSLSPEGRTHF